jgi:hypothetical protein
MKFYIENNVSMIHENTPKCQYILKLRNHLIKTKEYFEQDTGILMNGFNKAIYTYRTFDYTEQAFGLSYENQFLEDAYFWLYGPPAPFVKHHTGYVCTKNTLAIILLFNSIRPDISEIIKNFIPTHCTIKRDMNYEHKTSKIYRNDYYYSGKKVGAVDDIIYNDHFHYFNIVLNSKLFCQEDFNDIKILSEKYQDVYYKKSPAYLDGIGPSILKNEEFKDLFLNYFSKNLVFDFD